jgi:chromosome segregation ATPase
MKPDSDWEALRARLAQTQAAVAAEINAYPPPIPACDAQYNHLLERREALSAALARLDTARKDGADPAQSLHAELSALAADRGAGE